MFTVQNALDQLFASFYYGALKALTDFQQYLGNMGAEIFDNAYAQALLYFFNLFAWSLLIAGSIMAIGEFCIDAQKGGGNIKETGINILTGFFAVYLFEIVPENLFRLSVNLQSVIAKILNLAGYQADTSHVKPPSSVLDLLSGAIGIFQSIISGNPLLSITGGFTASDGQSDQHIPSFVTVIFLIAFLIAFVKVLFDNIKRGAILLAQICVCALYMISIPRGYTDGFFGWCKQIAGICFTTFLQNMFLIIGLNIFKTQMIVGLGVMLGAAEIPRIAQAFGLETGIRANFGSISMAVNSFANIGRTLMKGGA